MSAEGEASGDEEGPGYESECALEGGSCEATEGCAACDGWAVFGKAEATGVVAGGIGACEVSSDVGLGVAEYSA